MPTPSDQELSLYSSASCPFCVRVLRHLELLNIDLEVRSTHLPEHRQALIAGGGRATVPCLRIEEPQGSRWLYESLDIIDYLQQRFGQ